MKPTCTGSVMVEKTNANGFKTGMDILLSAMQAKSVRSPNSGIK